MRKFLTQKELELALGEELDELHDENEQIDAVYIPPEVDQLTDEEDLSEDPENIVNSQNGDIAGTFEIHTAQDDIYDESDEEDLATKQEVLISASSCDESTTNSANLEVEFVEDSNISRAQDTSTTTLSPQHLDDSATERECSTPALKRKSKSSRTIKSVSTFAFEERSQKRMNMLEGIYNNRKKIEEAEDHVNLFMKSIALTVKKLPLSLITKAKIEQLKKHRAVKINVELFGQYVLHSKETTETKSFNTKNKIITSDSEEIFNGFLSVFKEKVLIFTENGSGWALEKILFLKVNVNKYKPIRASSYIPLPKQIKYRKAVINVKNND
ncbi:unnamed protein product [Ceutorhynchus assimilis]|uniref:Uncharacterized protein n=1 Tax=Ceutorhynchus assimilis TaxID=467358 RepID=A0A9N9MX97_9CUCU|nr:unnamed protein product [Ceutorhynchus assimilis]